MGSIKVSGNNTGGIRMKSGSGGSIKIRAASGGGPFSPSSFPGLILWMDAGVDIYSDSGGTIPAASQGDPVLFWKDRSGFGNDFSKSTYNSPILNKSEGFSSIYFANEYTGFSSNTLNGRNPPPLGGNDIDFTIIVAWRPTATSYGTTVFRKIDSAGFGYNVVNKTISYRSDLYPSYDAAAASANSRIVQTLKGVKNSVNDPSRPCDLYLYANGNLLSTVQTTKGFDNEVYWNPEVSSTHPILIGGYVFYMESCLVYEVLFYNSALSDTDRTAVENYLTTKWSV